MSATITEIRDKHTVHWFRKGLRLHDNPSLKEGLKSAATFRCVFIIDPWFAGSSNVGINKWRFLLQCLEDLDRSLRRLNSRLFVVRGQPADALPKLFKEWGTTSLTFEEDPEPYGRVRDHNITSMCKEIGITVVSRVSHTLYKLDTIIEKNGGRAPLTYHQFQTIISSMSAPNPAEETITAETLGEAVTPVSDDHDDKFGVPTLEELGFDTEGLLPPVWVGGESEALARLERHLERKAWVASFGRPKMTPQSLLASQTGLSPYLRFGCLSTRLFYYQLTELYKKIKKARPPLSLHGQLLWREFFYCAATKNPNFDKMVGNPICVQIPWDKNNEALAKWANGQTGYPWIDAIMIQLREEGWIHHLARHAVACFLTRGDLWISWEDGMKVFEELLLDADWSVNAGTWMWLSCSSFFQQFFHCYCPVRFGRKADPNGDYIRKYIPSLKNFPTRYIHSPWLAPQNVQVAARCIVGQDYPMPMVDHAVASKSNIQRIKQVYHQLSKYRPQELYPANSINPPNVAVSSPSPNAVISSVNHSTYYCSTTPETRSTQQNSDEIENQNEEQQYAQYKKQDEDYENTKQTVSDLFTDKQSRNTSSLQVRNMPFKKIVVVDENYVNMKHEELNRADSYQDLNQQYNNVNKTYGVGKPDDVNEYREIQRQTGFYVERISTDTNNPSYVSNKIKNQQQEYGETSGIKEYNYTSYDKNNIDEVSYEDPSTSQLFKQPSSDTLYGMKKKSYYTASKLQQAKMNYNKIDDKETTTRIYNLSYQSYEQETHIDDHQYDSVTTNSMASQEYRSSSYIGNDLQNSFDNSTPNNSYESLKIDLNYRNANEGNNEQSAGVYMNSQVEKYSGIHDCSSEEEKQRFQQGKMVMMQGCGRPPNEEEP